MNERICMLLNDLWPCRYVWCLLVKNLILLQMYATLTFCMKAYVQFHLISWMAQKASFMWTSERQLVMYVANSARRPIACNAAGFSTTDDFEPVHWHLTLANGCSISPPATVPKESSSTTEFDVSVIPYLFVCLYINWYPGFWSDLMATCQVHSCLSNLLVANGAHTYLAFLGPSQSPKKVCAGKIWQTTFYKMGSVMYMYYKICKSIQCHFIVSWFLYHLDISLKLNMFY
jgi:hypothetical protein